VLGKNSTFTWLTYAQPALINIESTTAVADFHTCVFDTSVAASVVLNFAVNNANGIILVNCSIKSNAGGAVTGGGTGTLNRPLVGGSGSLEVEGGNTTPGTALAAGTTTAI